MCDLEAIVAPSIFELTLKAAALARMLPTLALSCEENAARRKWKSPLEVAQAELLKAHVRRVVILSRMLPTLDLSCEVNAVVWYFLFIMKQ